MTHIKAGLQMGGCVVPSYRIHLYMLINPNSKKNTPYEEPIFQCIGMLASAVGPNLTSLLHDQLDLMFACGLSESLRTALTAIARHIPPLLKTIQGRYFA
jgi:serine/threonine-protein kinase mTOR